MAVLLVVGHAGLAQFQDDVVNRPDLQAMLQRVEFYNNPDADAAGADKMRSFVEVTLKDGRTLSGQSDFAKGSPQKPISFDDEEQKFQGCAEFAKLSKVKADKIVESVKGLDRVANMREVFDGIFE